MFGWLYRLIGPSPLTGRALQEYIKSTEVIKTHTLTDGRVIEYRVFDAKLRRKHDREQARARRR